MASIGAAWVDGAWVEAGWVSGAWLGVGITAPTVEAGGPYASLGALVGVQLNATVTPGTDLTPTNKWTVQSGGTGSFDDDTLEDPIFTPDTAAASVLLLTVTSADAGIVTDTATFSAFVVSTARPSGVRARPAYPRRLQIFGKRYWVDSLREEKALLERLYAEEAARLERRPAAIQAKATQYKVKRAQTRLQKIEEIETREARIRQLDEELLTFFM